MKAVELCEVGMPNVYNADDLLDFRFKGSFNKIGHLHVSVRAGIIWVCMSVGVGFLSLLSTIYMTRINLRGGRTIVTPEISW